MKKFIPEIFSPSEIQKFPTFILRKLTADDVHIDYLAAMSSVDIIKKIRGGNWPTPNLTEKDDFIDLCWHQREFEYKISFAYIILSLDQKESLGCIYIYPPDKPWINAPDGTDAVVNMWVTQKEYDKGFYPVLFGTIKIWIEKEWPFKSVFYSNKEIPKELS